MRTFMICVAKLYAADPRGNAGINLRTICWSTAMLPPTVVANIMAALYKISDWLDRWTG